MDVTIVDPDGKLDGSTGYFIPQSLMNWAVLLVAATSIGVEGMRVRYVTLVRIWP